MSLATLARIVFPRPHDGTPMLALERKATCVRASGYPVHVRTQPFGGAVRFYNLAPLHSLIGDFDFDSERSQSERDFRLLIRPSDWQAVKQFCLWHLSNPDDAALESDPSRELTEEFDDALKIRLEPGQYLYQPAGFIVQNDPTPTDNVYARGRPTVRIYRIFEVRILDASLVVALLANSERHSDWDLQTLALEDARNGGAGRANAVLTLPLKWIVDFYLAIPPETRYTLAAVGDYQLDASVPAVLEEVDLPQFVRL